MSTTTEAPPLATTNRILNALTRPEYERLSGHPEPFKLWTGDVLCQPEQPITHVFFPNRGTVSVVSAFADGGTVEVGMVGNEQGGLIKLRARMPHNPFSLQVR